MKSPLLRAWPAILLILLAGFAVYSNTFEVPFVFDDDTSITRNEAIRSLDIFSPDYGDDGFFPPNRFVTYVSFAANYHLGGLDVRGYHVVNLLIHLLSGLLVYALLSLTLRTPFFRPADPAGTAPGSPAGGTDGALPQRFIPLLAALLFVVHPVQTQAVTYVVQRTTSLATLLYLAAAVLYVQARLRLHRRAAEPSGAPGKPVGLAPAVTFLIAAGVVAALGMKTKEIVFTLPFTMLLFEFFFFRGPWLRRLLYLTPLLATLPIIPLTIFTGDDASGDLLADSDEMLRVGSSMPRSYYLFTQFRVIVTYLRLLVLPVDQNLDYDYPVYTEFLQPPVILSFLLLGALLILAGYLFMRSREPGEVGSDLTGGARAGSGLPPGRAYLRLISFGILWFFLTLSVESSVVPIIDVIMEHRLYLPMVGAAAAFSCALYLLLRRAGSTWGRVLQGAALLLVVLLGIAAYQRNQVWTDRIGLWRDVVAKAPNKGRALNNLGVALEDIGRREEAIQVLSRATVVDPAYYMSYYNLADLLLVSDRPEQAVPLLQTTIRLQPDFTEAYVSMGAALMRSGRFQDVARFLEQNLQRVGEHPEARFYLGSAYAFLGDRQAALRELEIVSRRDPALAANLAAMLGVRSSHGAPQRRP